MTTDNLCLGVRVFSTLWTILLTVLAVPLGFLVRGLRRWQLGRRGVLELSLSHDMGRRAPLDGIAQTASVLRSMAEDDLLRAVVLRVRNPSLGWAAAQDLRRALRELRDAGKLVVVELEQAGNQELYLAAEADRVWLAPAGEVFLTGLGTELVFYGDLLDRLGVDVDMEAAGAFKSFGEPFSRAFPSPDNREATAALVEDLGDQLVDALATARRIPADEVRALMDRAPLSAHEAQEAGLVDALGYRDEVRDDLESLLGQQVRPIPFRGYARLLRWERALRRWGRREPRVAIVHLEGPVVHGTEAAGGSGHRIDADRVVPVLERLREDDRVGAAVLFVNSPGGSALASDLIAHAVERLDARKPVVAVMANVAASGGYYVAAPCREILASPGTITGSIGVVGGKVSLGRALGQVGVHHEGVTTSESALFLSPWRGFSDSERERFRGMLARTYMRFIAVVARGRGMSPAAVEPFAQGRVWTGRQALAAGLVDDLGGLGAGIDRARLLGGLRHTSSELHLRFPPPRLRILSQLVGREVQGARAEAPDMLAMVLRTAGAVGRRLSLVRAHPAQALALLPFVLVDGLSESD